MAYVKAFIAGFLSTLIFHQAVIALFHALGAIPRAAWDMQPTPPFGVPAVISLAFFGGLWGMLIWPLIRSAAGAAYWWRAIVIGSVGPSAVALLVVFPLKGMPSADPKIIIGALIVNAVWGFGLALLMRSFARQSA